MSAAPSDQPTAAPEVEVVSARRRGLARSIAARLRLLAGIGVAGVVVLVALLIRKPTLDENGTGWWIAVAVVGFVSGALGLVFLRWRARRKAVPRG